MNISPDNLVFWEWQWLHINATILYTWFIMALLTVGSWLITRRLTNHPDISRWQNLLEVLVEGLRNQIHGISQQNPDPYLPFIGTLFVYILTANFLLVLPGFIPPTGSLSTAIALALCVFLAVPVYGIYRLGPLKYLKNYLKPTPLMLPFNVISELSRTIALAVRLYGNVMSGTVIIAVLVALSPLFFPVIMKVLGLITGTIQAYIFAILATVYIASANQTQNHTLETQQHKNHHPVQNQ